MKKKFSLKITYYIYVLILTLSTGSTLESAPLFSHRFDNLSLLELSPSSLAWRKDYSFYNSTDFSSKNFYSNTTYFFYPGLYGNITGGFSYEKPFNSSALSNKTTKSENLKDIRLGLSKYLNSYFSLGLYNYFRQDINYILSSFTINTKSNIHFSRSWGLYHLQFGSGLGKNISNNSDPLVNSFLEFFLLYSKTIKWKYFLNIQNTISGEISSVTHNNIFYLTSYFSLGFSLNSESQNNTWALNTGLHLPGEYFKGALIYSLSFPKEELYHSIALQASFNFRDKKGPDIKWKQSSKFLTLNYDGFNDTIIFNPIIKDSSEITFWKLNIYNDKNNLVKSFSINNRNFYRGFSLLKTISNLWKAKIQNKIQQKIVWDGLDTNSKPLSDGTYSYEWMAVDAHNNKTKSKKGFLIIDRIKPSVHISLNKNKVYNPLKRKWETHIIIQQKTEYEDPIHDKVISSLKDEQKKLIKSFYWKASATPLNLDINKLQLNLKPGIYTYSIYAKDDSLNTSTKQIVTFKIKKQDNAPECDILSKEWYPEKFKKAKKYYNYLNPEEKKKYKVLNYFPIVFKVKNYKIKNADKWKLFIYYKKEKGYVLFDTLTGIINKNIIIWNGKKHNSNDFIPDGKYKYIYKIYNKDYKFLQSSLKHYFSVQKYLPRITIKNLTDTIQPDDDFINDYIIFKIKKPENLKISFWKLKILEKYYTIQKQSKKRIFIEYSGSNKIPDHIYWTGKDKNGLTISSPDIYSYKLEWQSTDGRKFSTEEKKIFTQISITKIDPNTFMICTNGINFSKNSSSPVPEGLKKINKIKDLISSIQNYNYNLEFHHSEIGDDFINLELSENAAFWIKNYFKKDSNINIVDTRGMGETELLSISRDSYPQDYINYRNQRLKIFLIPKTNK